jgi:hypothetical protein
MSTAPISKPSPEPTEPITSDDRSADSSPKRDPAPNGASSENAESPATRVAKLLPADLTAAFLSAKAGLETSLKETNAHGPIFWTFIALLAVSPFYFRYVNKARDPLHISFLTATFAVFATSIAYVNFIGYLGAYVTAIDVNMFVTAIAIVLPGIWAFVVAPAVLEKLKETGAS